MTEVGVPDVGAPSTGAAALRRPVGRARRVPGERGVGGPGARPRALRGGARGITREGRWLLAEAARPRSTPGNACRRVQGRRAPGRGAGGARPSSSARPPRAGQLGPIDVVSPPAARALRRGRDRPGPPRAGRRCRTWAAGVLGSAVGMDKVMMKRAFRPRPAHAGSLPLREDFDEADVDRVEAELGLPVLREAGQPGLVGRGVEGHRPPGAGGGGRRALALRRVGDRRGGDHRARDRGGRAGRRPPEASLPGEIIPGAEFYTYEDKYSDGRASAGAGAARRRPDGRGAARDAGVRGVPLRGDGAGRLLPRGAGRGGSSSTRSTPSPGSRRSRMYPKLWEVTGVLYPALLDRLIVSRSSATSGAGAARGDRRRSWS